MSVFDDDASVLWADEQVAETFGVVDDEQAGTAGIELAEADVGRSTIGVVIVLDESLKVEERREVIACARLDQVRNEASLCEINVVVAPEEASDALGLVEIVQSGIPRLPVAGAKASGVEAARIGQVSSAVLIRARRDGNAVRASQSRRLWRWPKAIPSLEVRTPYLRSFAASFAK